jgi:hypothetical protein
MFFPLRARPRLRPAICLGATAAILAGAAGAQAQNGGAFPEVETKYIFGHFTLGAEMGEPGKAFEPDTKAAFGKRGGRYATSETELELDYTPNEYLQIELGPRVAYYGIHNVPGLGDRNMGAISGFAVDVRSLIVQREHSPFAVALSVEPEFHNRDETGGERVSSYSVETKLEADAELIKKRLFLAFNLLYQPEATRAAVGGWDKESTLGVSSALAFQIVPNVVVGVDLWYLRHYQGGAFNSFTGDAVYLGPTFYWKIAPKVLMSAAWEAQVAGCEIGVSSALDLTDFSRQRATLLIEFEF